MTSRGTKPIGARQVYPVMRPFPIWRYVELDDFLTGRLTGEWGWRPDRFLTIEVGSALAKVFPMRPEGRG